MSLVPGAHDIVLVQLSARSDCMHQTTSKVELSAFGSAAICPMLWSSACQASTVATGDHHHGLTSAACYSAALNFSPAW